MAIDGVAINDAAIADDERRAIRLAPEQFMGLDTVARKLRDRLPSPDVIDDDMADMRLALALGRIELAAVGRERPRVLEGAVRQWAADCARIRQESHGDTHRPRLAVG